MVTGREIVSALAKRLPEAHEPVGRDSVESTFERSEASTASIRGTPALTPALHEPLVRSADLQSAVSRIFNPQRARSFGSVGRKLRPAECNSAIQMIANLRYDVGRHASVPLNWSAAILAARAPGHG